MEHHIYSILEPMKQCSIGWIPILICICYNITPAYKGDVATMPGA